MWNTWNLKDYESLHKMPTDRNFLISGYVVFIIFFVFFRRVELLSVPVVLTALAFFVPKFLHQIHRGWYIFGLFLGWLLSPLTLSLFYFLIFVPMALVLKLFGHKAFLRKGWIHKKKSCDFVRPF